MCEIWCVTVRDDIDSGCLRTGRWREYLYSRGGR